MDAINHADHGHLMRSLTSVFFFCNLLLCESCHAVAPTHLPTVFLSDNCEQADFQGLRKLTIHSQRDLLYSNNVDCVLLLSTRSGYVMRFRFEHLDFPDPTSGVCEDSVQVYNGHSEEMHLTRPICGSKRPEVFTSNSSNVALHFRTNSKNQRSGFRLHVERWPQTTQERVGCTKDQGHDCMVTTQSPRPVTEPESGTSLYSWPVVIIGLLLAWTLIMYSLLAR